MFINPINKRTTTCTRSCYDNSQWAIIFCHGGQVTLSANEATSYLWSNGEVTRDILVSSTGNYTVTITDGNGCTSASTTTSVNVVDQIVATISSNGPLTFCQGGSVTLKSNNAASYLWNNGATNQEIEVGTTGDYQVTITDQNGCTGISNITMVKVNETPMATITPNSETTFCEGVR